jgi:hypothetical protein
LTRSLRSSLKKSLREETEAFVSRLSRKFVMIRKSVNKWTIARCKRNYEEKWNLYDLTYKSTCLRKAQLLNE